MTKLAGSLSSATVMLAIMCVSSNYSYAQGCSDAGFCSVGSMGLHTTDEVVDSSFTSLTVGIASGIGDYKLFVLTPKLELAYRFANGIEFSSRITMQTNNGDLGTVTGLGDVYFTADLPIIENLNITAGIKMPFTSANAQVDEKPVPMDYQTSLGTIDVIAGVTFTIDQITLSLAGQFPLIQNENMFDPRLYPPTSAAQQYPSTVLFYRQPDVLMRLAYNWSVSDDVSIVPSVLPILHIANDSYADSMNVRSDIEGSAGVTVNAAILISYQMSQTSSFGLTLAAPFVTRTARPDGLTRKFVAALEYTIRL